MGTELEIKLAIVSDNPGHVVNSLASLGMLGAFPLIYAPTKQIQDRYFDLPEGQLAASKANLRLRTIEGFTLITVKSGDRQTSNGIRRNEYEALWSDVSLAKSLELISELVAIETPWPTSAADDARTALEMLGFGLIQERTTTRRTRHVVMADHPEQKLAELAIDSVQFEFGTHVARFHEVEIERISSHAPVPLSAIAQELTSGRPELREWPFSKVVTGQAIQALIAQQGDSAFVGGAGDLLPAAYEIIARQLS